MSTETVIQQEIDNSSVWTIRYVITYYIFYNITNKLSKMLLLMQLYWHRERVLIIRGAVL